MTLPFHGHPDWQTSLNTADLFSTQNVTNIGPGGSLPVAVFDFRAYSSYYLDMEVVSQAPAAALIPIRILVRWSSDLAGTSNIYSERFEIFADGNNGAAPNPTYGRFMLQDSAHGPYFRLSVTNAGIDAVTATISVLGNSRTLGRRYVQNVQTNLATVQDQDMGALLNSSSALGAGANSQFIIPMHPGLATHRIVAVTAPFNFVLFSPSGSNLNSWALLAGVDIHETLALPRCAYRAVVTNTGGVGGTGIWQLNSARDNW